MKQYRRKRARMQDDPDYAARVREQWREAHRRHRASKTEEELEAEREWQRQWYAENRDYILEQRRQRLAAMSPEDRATYDEHRRRLGREWRRRWRAWLEEHPEEKARYQERYREWIRERELRELMTALEQLGEQHDD
jgi:aromatic ring hydroxylase